MSAPAIPVTVSRDIVGDCITVHVAVDPTAVLPALLTALTGQTPRGGAATLAHLRAVGTLASKPLVRDALTVSLAGDEAWWLGREITRASMDVETCCNGGCPNYAVVDDYCEHCAEALL